RDRTYARASSFAAGETVVLRVENNTAGPIHFRADPRQREVHRGEDLVVQRGESGRWSDAVLRTYIDESPVRCIELRPGMNVTRAWTPRTPVPGTYRVQLTFATTAAGCASDRTAMREIQSAPFTVTAAGFRVTRVAAAAAVGPTGACPVQVTFTGTVQATGPGTVRYQWERSDGAAARPFSINFTAAGTRTVRSTWTLGAPGRETSGWQRLRLLEPHATASEPASFRFRCGA
ncbi:MAG TPA: hypothetical protein VF705_08995, partial [Longimicrobium sp.]